MPPTRPKKICSFQPCGAKTSGRYCNRHKDKERKYGFSSELDPWYQKKVWRGNPNKPLGQRGGLRERKLLSDVYCKECKENGIYKDCTAKGAGVVDHRTPFRSVPEEDQWEYFTDWDNLQVLCRSCHNSKSATEANR